MNRGAGTVLGFALLAVGAVGTLGSVFFYPLFGILLGAFASVLPPSFVVVGVIGTIVIGGGKGRTPRHPTAPSAGQSSDDGL